AQSFTADGLPLRRAPGDAGVKNGGDLNAREHAASEASSRIISTEGRRERNREVLPVNQIGTDGMRPVHVSPYGRARVELEKHVVLAAEKSRRTGIVHPVS